MHEAFLERVLSHATAWLLTYGIHSSVLLGGTWLVLRTKLVRSLATQDALWKTALLGALVTATLHSALDLPRWSVAEHGNRAPGEASASLAATRAVLDRAATRHGDRLARAEPLAHPALVTHAGARPRAGEPSLARPGLPWALVALVGWLATASLGLTRLLATRLRLRRHLGARRQVTDPRLSTLLERLCRDAVVGRPVRLSVSPLLATPIAYGRSEICVPPRALTELTARQQEAMLAHELAHLVRRDPAWRTVTSVLRSVFVFQPLNTVAARRIQALAELLCDDWAVQRTGRRLVLAQCLARVAGWIEEERPALPAPAMAQPGSNLVQRVRRLAAPTSEPARVHPRRTALAATALLLAVSCGMPTVSSSETRSFVSRCLSLLRGTTEEVASADRGQEPLGLQLVATSTTRFTDLLKNSGQQAGRPANQGCEHCEHCQRKAREERAGSAQATLDDQLEQLSRELEALVQRLDREAERLDRERPRPRGHGRPPAGRRTDGEARQWAEQLEAWAEESAKEWERASEEYEAQLEEWAEQYEAQWEQYEAEWERQEAEWEEAQEEWEEDEEDEREREAEEPEWVEEYEKSLEEWAKSQDEQWEEWADEYGQAWEEWAEQFEEAWKEHPGPDGQAWQQWLDTSDPRWNAWVEELGRFQDRRPGGDHADPYEALREQYRRAFRGRNCDHDCKRRCRNGCTHPDEDRPDDDSEDGPEPDPRDPFVRSWPGTLPPALANPLPMPTVRVPMPTVHVPLQTVHLPPLQTVRVPMPTLAVPQAAQPLPPSNARMPELFGGLDRRLDR